MRLASACDVAAAAESGAELGPQTRQDSGKKLILQAVFTLHLHVTESKRDHASLTDATESLTEPSQLFQRPSII